MPETTFERIRRVILSGYEDAVNPDTIQPESTLEELNLIEYFFGPTSAFLDLEDDFKKDYPTFAFQYDDDVMETTTVQEIVDLVEKELQRAGQVQGG